MLPTEKPINEPGEQDNPLSFARLRFAEEGLPFPPAPVTTPGQWRQIGNHTFATRTLSHPLYDLDRYFAAAQNATEPDYAALGFDGHGINSWACHFYLLTASAAIFLQCRWGNALADANRERERIDGVFGLTGLLIASLTKARSAGRLGSGQRLLVRFSDFSGAGWGWAGQPDTWREDGDFTLLGALEAVESLPGLDT